MSEEIIGKDFFEVQANYKEILKNKICHTAMEKIIQFKKDLYQGTSCKLWSELDKLIEEY